MDINNENTQIFDECIKKEKIEISGQIASGTQYDLDIKLAEDQRDVVFGTIKNQFGFPIENAVVKLLEIKKTLHGSERIPVTHTFSDKYGQFVFGPLCVYKRYAIEIWANKVDHVKICKICKPSGKCLHGISLDCKHQCEAEFSECLEDNSLLDDDSITNKNTEV